MGLRITAVSFFYRFLYKILKIPQELVDKMATRSYTQCMDDIIIMKFGQNVQNKILFTYL